MAPTDSPSAGEAEKKEAVADERRCVSCGWKVRTLYVQYSPGNIRLMKCDNCKAVADPYIECEFMIILIDLILHKTMAYRHLLFNMVNIGACDSKVLLNIVLPTLIFMLIILLTTKLLQNSANSFDMLRYKGIMLAILISIYFELFQVAIMVWEFPPYFLFIVDIFVLTSNALSLEVITNLHRRRCLAVCFCAHAFKKFSKHRLLHLFIRLILRTKSVNPSISRVYLGGKLVVFS